jgi:DNA-directed RNA polymerase beta subunit
MSKNYFLQDIDYYLEVEKSKKIDKKLRRLEVPNFLEIQYFSFFRFLKYGLKKELQRWHIWVQPSCFEYTYYPQNLRVEIPSYSYQEILRAGGSFSSRVILPRSFYDYQNEKIYFKWIILGSLPILTRNGHFLINGLVRVCIIQIVRGAGIYINKKVDRSGHISLFIDIVPDRGTWVRLEKDFRGRAWICIRGESRLSIWSIMQTIGLLSFSSYFISIPIKNTYSIDGKLSLENILTTNKSFSNRSFFDIIKISTNRAITKKKKNNSIQTFSETKSKAYLYYSKIF